MVEIKDKHKKLKELILIAKNQDNTIIIDDIYNVFGKDIEKQDLVYVTETLEEHQVFVCDTSLEKIENLDDLDSLDDDLIVDDLDEDTDDEFSLDEGDELASKKDKTSEYSISEELPYVADSIRSYLREIGKYPYLLPKKKLRLPNVSLREMN